MGAPQRVPPPDILTTILVVLFLLFLLAAAIFEPVDARGAAHRPPAAAHA